jgi:hypothetical protein
MNKTLQISKKNDFFLGKKSFLWYNNDRLKNYILLVLRGGNRYGN